MAGTTGWTSNEAVNWDDVSTEAPPPIADGMYRAVFVKAEPRPTKEGKPAISLELSVLGAFGGADLPSPRKLFDNVMCSAAAAFRVKQLAAATAVNPPASFGLDPITEFCNALVDAPPFIFKSKQSTYQGKTNAKVDRYFTEAQAAEEQTKGEQPSAEAPAARPVRTRKAAAAA
jgi:hypothetical protein